MPFEINGESIRTVVTVGSLIVASASLVIAFLNRRELRRAHIVISVFPIDGQVCIGLSNTGQRLAYNVQFSIEGERKSRLSRIHYIAPDVTYRVPFVPRSDIKTLNSGKLLVSVSYNDCLNKNKSKPVKIGPIEFNLDEMIEYNIVYNGDEKAFVVWPPSD